MELQPNYIDAIVAKGALLIELPWLLGGDEDEGERLLRRALQLDADFEPARARLEALDPDGALSTTGVGGSGRSARDGGCASSC